MNLDRYLHHIELKTVTGILGSETCCESSMTWYPGLECGGNEGVVESGLGWMKKCGDSGKRMENKE